MANISLQKQHFPGMRLLNPTFFPCMYKCFQWTDGTEMGGIGKVLEGKNCDFPQKIFFLLRPHILSFIREEFLAGLE